MDTNEESTEYTDYTENASQTSDIVLMILIRHCIIEC